MRPVLRFAGLLALSVAGGCSGDPAAPTAEPRAAITPMPAAAYTVRGRLIEVAEDAAAITVAHEDIPGLMPAMTMAFALESSELARGLGPGARIEMTLLTAGRWRVSGVRVLEAPPSPDTRAKVEPPPREPRAGERYFQLGVGELVPEFRLIDQSGRPLALSDLRGRVVALTFLYTRCPMPEFCPLVTRRLVELQRALGPELRARTRIVAVSIDPEHDTPPILERYARDKGLSPETTALLTGPEREVALLSSYFGLEYWPEADGTIAHKVRLAVIDTRGRLHARLQGTDWTTDEILRLVRQALAEAGA